MILAMNPLDSLPVSPIQSQIGAMEGVQAQIAEVAASVKAVQGQVVDVGEKIENTKKNLKQANLPPDDKQILMMELKSLIDEKKSLMDKELSLIDEKKSLMQRGSVPLVVADFSAVWTAIVNDEIIENEKNPRLWSLPGGLAWIGGVQDLYNRPCYDIITADISSVTRALVIGTPGIGKTLYLQVFLVHLARKAIRESRPPPSITYVYAKDGNRAKYSFLPDGSVVDISSVPGMPNPDYELSDSIDLSMPSGKTLSLLVASDKEVNYNDFWKRIKEAKFGRKLIMPLFSFEELRIIAPSMDQQVAQFRHDVFGGSARNFVFGDAVSTLVLPIVEDVLSQLFRDLKASNTAPWDVAARQVSDELQRRSADSSLSTVNSMMWHMQADGSKNWASKVMQMLAGEICEGREMAIATALEQMVGKSGMGNAFECLGHRKLTQSTVLFLLKPLLENLQDEKPDFEWANFSLPIVAFRRVDEIANLPVGTYGLPMIPNFPISDAILQPDTLLQFTTSLKHRGSIENLNLQRAELAEKNRAKHKFVFVVPKENVRAFRYQAGLGDIRQFVCLSEPSAVDPVTLMSGEEKEKWEASSITAKAAAKVAEAGGNGETAKNIA